MWMNFEHMGWGSGPGGMLGFAPMALWWGVLILVVALIVKWLLDAGTGRRSDGAAREILAERYARGEIDREEFQKRRRDLNL